MKPMVMGLGSAAMAGMGFRKVTPTRAAVTAAEMRVKKVLREVNIVATPKKILKDWGKTPCAVEATHGGRLHPLSGRPLTLARGPLVIDPPAEPGADGGG